MFLLEPNISRRANLQSIFLCVLGATFASHSRVLGPISWNCFVDEISY